MRIYNETMEMLHVQLDSEETRKVQALRDQGVEISSLVREAIGAAYERRRGKLRPEDVDHFMSELEAAYPEPPNTPPREFDVHNRREFQEAFARHLRKKRA